MRSGKSRTPAFTTAIGRKKVKKMRHAADRHEHTTHQPQPDAHTTQTTQQQQNNQQQNQQQQDNTQQQQNDQQQNQQQQDHIQQLQNDQQQNQQQQDNNQHQQNDQQQNHQQHGDHHQIQQQQNVQQQDQQQQDNHHQVQQQQNDHQLNQQPTHDPGQIQQQNAQEQNHDHDNQPHNLAQNPAQRERQLNDQVQHHDNAQHLHVAQQNQQHNPQLPQNDQRNAPARVQPPPPPQQNETTQVPGAALALQRENLIHDPQIIPDGAQNVLHQAQGQDYDLPVDHVIGAIGNVLHQPLNTDRPQPAQIALGMQQSTPQDVRPKTHLLTNPRRLHNQPLHLPDPSPPRRRQRYAPIEDSDDERYRLPPPRRDNSPLRRRTNNPDKDQQSTSQGNVNSQSWRRDYRRDYSDQPQPIHYGSGPTQLPPPPDHKERQLPPVCNTIDPATMTAKTNKVNDTSTINQLVTALDQVINRPSMKGMNFEIPTFKGGEDEYFETWQSDFDHYCTLCNWDDQMKLKSLGLVLKERARQIYQDLPQDKKLTWPSVIRELQEKFGRKVSTDLLDCDNLDRIQAPKESVRDYTIDIVQRLRNAGITDNKQRFLTYYRGLLPQIKRMVFIMRPTSLEMCEQEALLVERNLRKNGSTDSTSVDQSINNMDDEKNAPCSYQTSEISTQKP